jgi:general secretion pathway protein A
MYETHFGFREKPFTLLPDPAFLFLGKQHSAALSLLEYSLENEAGFAVLTGAIGSGKTTLIRHVLDHAARDLVVGLVSNTHPNFGELLRWALFAFGVEPKGPDKAALFQTFVNFLLEQYARNRRTVLIIDEAQNLGPDALEELRLLSNVNADKHQILQTILVGQPQLRELLQQPALSQFVQRIAVHFHLDPLNHTETTGYIRHRLALAGGDPELFDGAACALVYRYSSGLPRVINVICDTALVYGYGAGVSRIGAEVIREVVRDKVRAGLFSLPQGIDDDELAGIHSGETPAATDPEAPTTDVQTAVRSPRP